MSGAIEAVGAPGKIKHHGAGGTARTAGAGTLVGGAPMSGYAHVSASFVPHFVSSASIDTILDHVATTRFSSGSQTFLTFQNNTQINSTLIFCRATADEFNYSSNPTFRNSDGELVVIDPGDDTGQRTFTFVTTVGLYNSNNGRVYHFN